MNVDKKNIVIQMIGGDTDNQSFKGKADTDIKSQRSLLFRGLDSIWAQGPFLLP